MLRAVTFDATGTLFHCPRLGGIYAEILNRHGVALGAARAAKLAREVWAELDCSGQMERDRFVAHSGGARGWWRRFLDRLCERVGAGPASRFAAAELYDRFSHADAWELYDDVPSILECLAEEGLETAVISNWDSRLPGLLQELGVADSLEPIVYSAGVGFEKPHPGIFESALASLGLEPEDVLHVGDSRRRDVEGAQAVGMSALCLDRSGGGDLESLAELPGSIEQLLAVGGGASR